MNRRNFIKRGAIWCPAIVGLKSYPQALTFADPARVPVTAAGQTCSVVTAWQQTTNNDYWAGSVATYMSQKIKNSFGYDVTICQVDFWFKDISAATNNVYVKARSGYGSTGSDYGSASDTLNLSASYDNWATFTWTGTKPVIPASTDFYVGWYASGSHHCRVGYDTTPPIGTYYEDSTYQFWQNASSKDDSDLVFRIYILQ